MKNINDILKKAKELQEKIKKIQEELERLEVTGEAGGMVKAIVNGKLDILSIEISKEVFKSIEKELLEDMIVAAIKDAQGKVKVIAKEKMAQVGIVNGIPGIDFPNGIN